ncbi:serine acetyltransferase [Caulobacter segnis]|uniref:serine O-acetyltransferase n=1 Tax=Caulobacter segnis TaxID=88688 RepID=UPI00240FB486|nr:serine acetyltransferase [Caulobacter segnis]MDG2520498.1 serine acetyltransferase [Caulobacter segnis]
MASKPQKLFMLASRGGLRGRVARKLLRVLFACDVSPGAMFSGPPNLHHPLGIVVGMGAVIGRNVTIYQGVTIGGSRSGKYPNIGDNVTIYANATIVGGVMIGDNAVVGANAFVVGDVPANAVVRAPPSPIFI